MATRKEPRRPSLATIVGSSLAVAAAGSLLAFSTLAEQAGLQGLATGGLQPAPPARGGGGHAITLPAPAAEPPRDPRDALTDLVRDAIARVEAPRAVAEPLAFRTTAPQTEARDSSQKKLRRPDRIDSRARVAVAGPAVSTDDDAPYGPPYGHAYGHHKGKHAKPEPARKPKSEKRHRPKTSSPDAPVYARTANDEAGKAKGAKPPKVKKVEKATGHGKGHSKHGHGNGKAKGRSKGKGHSKHGG